MTLEGDDKNFLGVDFLTWLWFYGENNEWAIPYKDHSVIHYGIDNVLVLKPDGEGCAQKLSGPFPAGSREAQTGLAEGKKVVQTRLIFVYGDKEWSVTVRGLDFQFASLQLAKPESFNVEERFTEFSEDIESFFTFFDHIYTHFLQLRFSDDWDNELLGKIQSWVAKKQT